VALPEHFIFREGTSGYSVEAYDRASRLPPSIAALVSFCFGAIGVAMGMAQAWFIGPLGKKVGNPSFGGDIGFELAFGFTFLSYVALRPIEKRYFGR